MTDLDHLEAAVLKDLGKMVIAGAGIIVLLALLLWGLVTSAEADGLVTVRSEVSIDPAMNITRRRPTMTFNVVSSRPKGR
jgi:heme O synthase-like polyprenyltransferase